MRRNPLSAPYLVVAASPGSPAAADYSSSGVRWHKTLQGAMTDARNLASRMEPDDVALRWAVYALVGVMDPGAVIIKPPEWHSADEEHRP